MKTTTTTLTILLLLAGCEMASVTHEESGRGGNWPGFAEQAALAAATGGVPLRTGFIWTGDAALAVILTEHGTPTSVADIRRMGPVERARAEVAVAEIKLSRVQERLAHLTGPNPEPVSTMTLAEDIAQNQVVLAHREQQVREMRDQLDFTIRYYPHVGVGATPPRWGRLPPGAWGLPRQSEHSKDELHRDWADLRVSLL